MVEIEILTPNWPAPKNVRAHITTRGGGISLPPYASFNLAAHVGDELIRVAYNRTVLQQQLRLPSTPVWINQVHGTVAVNAATVQHVVPEADAAFTSQTNVICSVLTADCLPILLCDQQGSFVAAIHAGWRGLANGIIEATRDQMQCHDLMAWLGPAISQAHFEVGDDVRALFLSRDKTAATAFEPTGKATWLCDLYAIARQRLRHCGIEAIYGGEYCTYKEQTRFFSYRRENQTGRFASLIWIDKLLPFTTYKSIAKE